MNCPHCQSAQTNRLSRTTDFGYATFHCKSCQRTFNERTGTPFNFLEMPTDIVFEVLLCRIRFKLSFRDVAELYGIRGFVFTHETVRDWEERFGPIFAQRLKAKRRHKVGQVWHVDETYLRIKGVWCYLYRGMDENGNLVDVMLSEKRDMTAAKAFFTQAQETLDQLPERVVTDGLSSYPRAIAETLGEDVEHEVRGCLGNPIEQDHRGIKQRYYPMLGFGSFESAKRFCSMFEEIRSFFRPRQTLAEFVSLIDQRDLLRDRVYELQQLFCAH
jgi:putative transposase